MSEKGRNRFQRTISLIQGLFLVGFGGLLLWASISTIVELLGRIRAYHSLLQYTGLGVCVFLGLVGFLYIKMGMMLCRHRHKILRWQMLLGLLTGLAVGLVLAFWVSILVLFLSIYYWEHFHWLRDGFPVMVAGGLAGYIARRHGLVWGGMIGIAHQLFALYFLIWGPAQSSGLPRPSRIPITVIIQDRGLLPSIMMSTLIVLLIGMASGYLGQFLAQKTLRQSISSDQGTSPPSRQA